MTFSKDVKSPVVTSLSTVSTEADEREQEDLSFARPGPSVRFRAHAQSSLPSPSSPPHNGHTHAWEVELEARLLEEMRVVMLLPVKPAMTALQDMLKDEMPKSLYPKVLTRIVNMLNQLVDQMTNFHTTEKYPTVNQRNAQRDITHLVMRVPAALIATMQVSRDRVLLPTNPTLPEVYWAVEKVNAVQEEVRELGNAFQKTSQSQRTSLMGQRRLLHLPMIDQAKELGVALLMLERQLKDDQDAYSTAAQRKSWTDMRDSLKGKAFPRPETVVARLSEIEQLRDELASDNKTMVEGYSALSALIGHIRDTRVQNPRELHAVNMLATLALDVAFILSYTARGIVESDIEGREDAVTAPDQEKVLTEVIGDIDAARQFLEESWTARALKNAPLFEVGAPLVTLKDILLSMKANVSQQIPLYEREQRRVSLETLRETLTSTVKDAPEMSGEWGVDALIRVANTLLSLERAEDFQDETTVITFERTLGKVVNGVLTGMAMKTAAPEGTVAAKMLKYAKNKAEEGAKHADALMMNFVHMGKRPSAVRVVFLHDQFEIVAAALENALHQFSSKTYLQKVPGKLQHEGRRGLHALNKVVSTVSRAQLKSDKWIAAVWPWRSSRARPVAADVQRHLRACLYPVIEALTMLIMAASSERESRKFNKHYGSMGRSKDAKYDAASFERYRQASVNAWRAFPWVQEKIAVLRSTLLALYEQSGDAETTAVVLELMAKITSPLADFDTLYTDWVRASKLQSSHRMDEIIQKIGIIKSSIKKAAELSVGAPQGIRSDESKRVRHLGAFLAGEKAKHLAEHPQEGALFDKKVSALLQQHAAELAPAKYGDMAQLIQDAYIDADNNMQLHLPTTEDVVKGVPGFWTKLAGSGPMAVARRVGKMAASGSVDMLFFVTGAYHYKVALSVSLKTLMFAYSLYRINDALERARKPWEPEDVTAAARWAVTDKLFRQYLFRIAKTAQPVGALKVLLPVGQTAYLLTRSDGAALLSEKVTVGKVAEEAGWLGGSKGVFWMGEAMTGKGTSGRLHGESSQELANERIGGNVPAWQQEASPSDKVLNRQKRHPLAMSKARARYEKGHAFSFDPQFLGKTIEFKVPRWGGKTDIYTYTMGKEAPDQVVHDMGVWVNKTIDGLKLGEITFPSGKIVPKAGQGSNYFWKEKKSDIIDYHYKYVDKKVVQSPKGSVKDRDALAMLNQSIMNPALRIDERASQLIKEFNNTPENINKPALSPYTLITVHFTNKDEQKKRTVSAGPGQKMFEKIAPTYKMDFKLKDILSGSYLYMFALEKKVTPDDYTVKINGNNRVVDFIASVDRTKLQSELQDEVRAYFNDAKKSEGFSEVMRSIMHMRIFEYIIKHGENNEFSDLLHKFYAGEIPVNDVYISGVRVPGMFSFSLGDGPGAKTLVLSIHTEQSFVFEKQSAGSTVYGRHGSVWRHSFSAHGLLPPSHWDDFDKVALKALPLYEKNKYSKKNPFNYRVNPPMKGEEHALSFQKGSYRGDMPVRIMNDIKDKLIKDYDTHIYSNTEQTFDNIMRIADIVASPASKALGAVGGPLGFAASLGIDIAYVGAKLAQAEVSDISSRSEELRSEAMWDAIFLAGSTISDDAVVGKLNDAVKRYRISKLANKKLTSAPHRSKAPGRGTLSHSLPEKNGSYIGSSGQQGMGNRHFQVPLLTRIYSNRIKNQYNTQLSPAGDIGRVIIELVRQYPKNSIVFAGSVAAGFLGPIDSAGTGLAHPRAYDDVNVDSQACKTLLQETISVADVVGEMFDDPDMDYSLEIAQEFFFDKDNYITKEECNQIKDFLSAYKENANPAQLQHLYRTGQLKGPLPENIPTVLRRIPIQSFDRFVLFMGTSVTEPKEFRRNLYDIQQKNIEKYLGGNYDPPHKARAFLAHTIMQTEGALNSMEHISEKQKVIIQDKIFGKGNNISKAEMIKARDFLLAFKRTASESELSYFYTKGIFPAHLTDKAIGMPQLPAVFKRISIRSFGYFVLLMDHRNADPGRFDENYEDLLSKSNFF